MVFFFLVFLMLLAYLIFVNSLSFSPAARLLLNYRHWNHTSESSGFLCRLQSLLTPHFRITRRKALILDQEKRWLNFFLGKGLNLGRLLICKSNQNLKTFPNENIAKVLAFGCFLCCTGKKVLKCNKAQNSQSIIISF